MPSKSVGQLHVARTAVFVAVFLVVSSWIIYQENQSGFLNHTSANQLEIFHPSPDFEQITVIKERKQAFFQFLEPLVREANSELLQQRDKIIALQKKDSLSDKDKAWLAEQYDRYRVKDENPDSLLLAVDTIPPSLALAQAAIESAWGTSRFALEANNFYGQWCFTTGCGLVPNQRPAGSTHEVRKFYSASQSVASYIHNLNSHPTYATLRQLRASARQNGNADFSGCSLAQGLERYSERGLDYVNSVRQLIRTNALEAPQQCQKIVPPQPEVIAETDSKPITTTEALTTAMLETASTEQYESQDESQEKEASSLTIEEQKPEAPAP